MYPWTREDKVACALWLGNKHWGRQRLQTQVCASVTRQLCPNSLLRTTSHLMPFPHLLSTQYHSGQENGCTGSVAVWLCGTGAV